MFRRIIMLLLLLICGTILFIPGPARAADQYIKVGDRLSGRLDTPVEVDNFRFQGQAGIQIRIRFTGEPGLEPAARLEVDNREVWFGGSPGSNVVDSGNLTLDSSNEYLLQVRSANGRAGNYVLETARSDSGMAIGNGGQIQSGTPMWGRLAGPGSGVRFSFNAQAGQTALINVRTGENLTVRITFMAPDGLVLWSERAATPNQSLVLPALTLPVSGAYQIYLTAGGASGGTYLLSLDLVSALPGGQ